MLKKIIVFLLLTPCVFGKSIDYTNKMKTQLQQILHDTTKKYDFSAAEISIYSPNWKLPISIYEGYSCITCQNKINENSLFQIGSITKTFISYIILQLINGNKLKLSDNLGKLLPEYPQWKFVTIYELLNNTSGIASYDKSFLWWWRIYLDPTYYWTSEHLISIIYPKTNYKPGYLWQYSNTNYVLLGIIIEKLTNKSLALLFNDYKKVDNIYELQNTIYQPHNLSKKIESLAITGYSSNGHNMSQINLSSFQASGAVLSNASDISIWYTYYSRYVINKYFPAMFIQTNSSKNLLYGFGMFAMLTKYGVIFFTPGLTSGYTSMALWLPNYNISIVYLLNRNLVRKNIHVELIEKILPIIIKRLSITSPDIQWGNTNVQNIDAIVSSFE